MSGAARAWWRAALVGPAARACVILGCLLGCAPVYGDAYLHAFAVGERAMHAGRYGEAARAFTDAADRALRVKDRDEARFMAARALQRAGRIEEARQSLRKLVDDSPSGPRTVRAELEMADLEIEHGDKEAGYRALFEAARKHPDHGVSRLAIQRLAQHKVDQGGEDAAIAWLHGIRPVMKGTALEQLVDYQIACALERMGKLSEARDAFVATARAHPYPFGTLTDDAFWHASQIEERLGNHQQAIAYLRELLGPRERADSMGSYERPRYSAAQLRIAELYRDGMRDHSAARREFHRLYTSHKTSVLRDDALWNEARLARDGGDTAEACSLVARLAGEFAQSRYAACGRELCPTAAVKAGSRPCARYILRQLRPEQEPSGEHASPEEDTPSGR